MDTTSVNREYLQLKCRGCQTLFFFPWGDVESWLKNVICMLFFHFDDSGRNITRQGYGFEFYSGCVSPLPLRRRQKRRGSETFFFLSPRVQVLVQSWSVEARSYGLQQVAIMSTFMASNMHLLARVLPARYASLCVWQWICCGEARLLPAVQQRYQHVDTVVQNSCCYDLNQS